MEQGDPYAKELRLLEHVLATARPGDVESVCAAVESFGEETLPGTGRWLKIAGGAKAGLLADAAAAAPEGGVVLEIGTYCGYSAARLAAAREGKARGLGPRVVSLEVDAAHAVIARNILAFAGMLHYVDILTGHSEDTLPWVITRLKEGSGGPQPVSMVFLDQRGSRYEGDLRVLERAGALREGAVVVADNVLKPGAPLFLWHVVKGGYSTRVLSMQEFAMSGVEDWMTVSMRRPAREQAEPAAPPQELRALEWKAEQMRARAHRPDHGGGGIGFDEWAGFAGEMREGLCGAGFVVEALDPA